MGGQKCPPFFIKLEFRKYVKKIRYISMKVKITIPTSLAEITLGQYKRYLNIQTSSTDERFLQAKMIEIFCNAPLEYVMELKYSDSEEITSTLDEMFKEKPDLIQRFKLGSKEYGFHPNLEELSLGEYIDLDTYIGDWENIERAMNVLYRPIIAKLRGKYEVEKYNTKLDEQILNIPMDAVLGSIFFLWNLGIELSQTMMKYLEGEQNLDLMQFLTSELNGDGIPAYMRSLRETLDDLNISPN
jgi:hypothetical protein